MRVLGSNVVGVLFSSSSFFFHSRYLREVLLESVCVVHDAMLLFAP